MGTVTVGPEMPGCQIHTSFDNNDSNKYKMPLKRVNGRLYKWCAMLKDNLLEWHKTLGIHMNKSHAKELLPGCPYC